MKKQVKIQGDYIKLDQLLKLSDAVSTGGHAKIVILEGLVQVNGEVIVQRGKKIRAGDIVKYEEVEFEIEVTK